jgi:hypothetical protein
MDLRLDMNLWSNFTIMLIKADQQEERFARMGRVEFY